MVKPEGNIVAECMLALSAAGATVWRNNTGAWKDPDGRIIRYGLCVGSSDLIGICADGVFLAIECKTAMGQPNNAQLNFIAAVRAKGGRAGIARTAADALLIALPI